MSREDFEVFRDIRDERRAIRADRLKNADTASWTQLSPYHFRKDVDGFFMDWWPSANKWLYKGKYYRGALPKDLKEKAHG